MRPTSGSNAWLPGRYGAGEQPQLPATIVVMPCSSSGASTSAWSGCGITQSLCECMSMKPGAITWPVQSRRRAPLASSSTPTAAMRPSAIATEAGKPSRPVPSSTVPWSRMRSKAMWRPSHAQTPWRNVHRTPRASAAPGDGRHIADLPGGPRQAPAGPAEIILYEQRAAEKCHGGRPPGASPGARTGAPTAEPSAYPVGSRRPCLREPAWSRGRPPRRVRVHLLTWVTSLTRLHPDARVRGGSRHEPGHARHRAQGRSLPDPAVVVRPGGNLPGSDQPDRDRPVRLHGRTAPRRRARAQRARRPPGLQPRGPGLPQHRPGAPGDRHHHHRGRRPLRRGDRALRPGGVEPLLRLLRLRGDRGRGAGRVPLRHRRHLGEHLALSELDPRLRHRPHPAPHLHHGPGLPGDRGLPGRVSRAAAPEPRVEARRARARQGAERDRARPPRRVRADAGRHQSDPRQLPGAGAAREGRGGARGPRGAPGEHHARVRRAPHLHPRAGRSRDGAPVLRVRYALRRERAVRRHRAAGRARAPDPPRGRAQRAAPCLRARGLDRGARRGPGHPDPHRRRRARLRRRRGHAVVDLVARRPARRAGPAGARQPGGRAPGHRAARGVKGEGMETPLRIAIADDHALFRHGLKSQLRLQPGLVVVSEVDRADQLAAMIAATPCDILLLDLQMERSALVDIKALAERVTVIVVTASERAEDALAALRSGARAVVFKRFAIETLMDAIAAVVDGNVWMPPALQKYLAARLNEPPEAPLTPREIEIVRQVAMGLRNAEVADRLSISEVTVKTHLNNIFQKLGLRGRTALALYAIRMGIVGVPDGSP